MTQFWRSKTFWVITFTILFLAVLVRFVNLDSLPVFADEAIYVRWAQIMRAEPSLRFLPLSDGKQPLYMWAISPALKVISDPLLAGRLFSGLVGLGTVLGVATAAFLLFKNYRIALISGLLWAVLPYAVFFERMALVDGTLVFFSIWFFNLLYLSQAHLRLDMALLAGFAGGFAWLTKSPAMFILAMGLTLIIYVPKYTKKNIALSLFLYLVSLTVAFAMYNILRLGPQFHMIALRNADYVYSFAESLQTPLDPLIPHLKDVFWFFFYLLTPFGLVLIPFGIFDGHRSHLKPRFTLSLFLLAPIFVESIIAKGFTARYLLSTIPFAVIIMAHGLEHLGQKTNRHVLTVAMAGLVVVTALWFDFRFIFTPANALLPANEKTGYLEEWTAGTGLKEVSQYLRSAAQNGPVMVGSEGFFGTPFDALGMYLNDVKNIRIIGIGISIDSVDQKLKNSLVDNQVFLVVNSSRFNADLDNLPAGLKLISSYPKAIRADGTRESLLFFQVVH